MEVIILNPLIGKERSEDKLVLLDILAKDSTGRRFNIEVQTRLPLCFPNRLLYYNCRNYGYQLRHGEGYTELRPAFSISLVDRQMFSQPEAYGRWHHSFRLRCDQDPRLVMTDDFEFHIIELPKFRPESDNIVELPPDHQAISRSPAANARPITIAVVAVYRRFRQHINQARASRALLGHLTGAWNRQQTKRLREW